MREEKTRKTNELSQKSVQTRGIVNFVGLKLKNLRALRVFAVKNLDHV